jgi:hypothetical protein
LATIVLAVALAGLGAYVYLVELPSERAKTEAETQEKKIIPFAETEITALTLRSAAGNIGLATGDDRKWKITAPISADADSREVESVLRALVLGKVTRVVEDKGTTLAPFGLEHPPVILTVKAGAKEETISLGDTGPISSTLYALRQSDQKVLLTDLAAKDFLGKALLTFRKKEVLSFDQAQVERLRLTYPPTEIALYRDDRAKPPRWTIRFPIDTLADQTEVRSFLFRLEDLKALGFVDAGPEQTKLLDKLGQPTAKITLYVAGKEQTVKLFQPDRTSGEAFALTTPDAPIYRITPTALKDLTRDLFALRDKRLLGVDRDDLAMLSVQTRDSRYVLINQNNEWVLEDAPTAKLDQQAVDLFVSRVINLPAEIQVVKETGPLAAYGLSSPAAEFTATTRDGKQKGRLVLGSKTGGLAYAIGQGLPGVHQVRADILTQIPSRQSLLTDNRPAAEKS